ncbi:LamG domain-containing protein [Candidatus Parabeggiatoa sp. HSG14]|uniref:LamG domain-containing protein n=1 Tax=Candidatus Parabeggiatoa sp. HSG14 TaxID=3055593 RepID=UPI0025A8BF05|nr:LamG domain-containing protein [Thiotrichales bacterium HSG14]
MLKKLLSICLLMPTLVMASGDLCDPKTSTIGDCVMEINKRIKKLEKETQAQQTEIQALKNRWILTDGLVAYYPFNGNANDVSGNGNHGTEHGNINYVQGEYGLAANFDGKSYVEIGDKLDAENQDWTISAWIKADKYYQHAKIINKGQTEAGTPKNSGYSLWLTWSELRFQFLDDANKSSYSSIPISQLSKGQFMLIIGILKRQPSNHAQLELYVNGDLVSSKIATHSSSNTNIPLAIGALHRSSFGSTSEFFKGTIDDIRIYNRALTDVEIQSLYKQR